MASSAAHWREDKSEGKPLRSDAQRNLDTVLRAAAAVFDRLGVDAPMRTVATEAGVGVGTIYRHFPQRADLIKAIIQREVDDCVDAGATLAKEHPPLEALSLWLLRLVDFAGTKRGLGPALHLGDAAYEALPNYVIGKLAPVLKSLLDPAAEAGLIGKDIDAAELLPAAMRLAAAASNGQANEARQMISLMVDGLRFRAGTPAT